ncbi:hypothetical protein FHS96_005685 [Sphingomonas zeicaulis]|uniref:NACHT domain-containing protein n=1 Tax=Sphingomonas zeicaulis TaxID=1632740 RepID=UPI003D236C43
MRSTTQKGNAFRDAVAQLLRAAGFRAETEIQIGYKNADVVGIWSRDEMAGKQRYAFEAKDYEGTLPLGQCTKFAHDYANLVAEDEIDHAWLISKGAISPEGRKAAQSRRGLQAMTFAELQRRLLLLDPYLKDLIGAHDASRLADYYIPPETPHGEDLEAHVRAWIQAADAPPLFVLGPYGKGKSTFANHLAATFAKEAISDPTARAPILVRLGEIADEQSLEGLLGKVLASQHRVQGYHFETFRELNRVGRFLIIYDGFDEMKHGLTPAKFQQVLTELMKLDEGDARILVLGRDTAFHDDAEFRAVIDGMVVTGAGRLVPAPDRRPYRHVDIRGFTPEEARRFVERYLPIRIEREGRSPDPAWIAGRVAELVSGQYDELLKRPVHAQMLCEIAVHPDQLRPNMSVYELFDTFVHYLLHREVGKRGRDSDFPIEVRRRFNASLAWWLWERGGASTTTLSDIPQALCDDAVRDIRHGLTRDEMRRELIQGCLVEKGATTIYFHRSLQEFLAAEHLIETDLLMRSTPSMGWLQAVTSALTPEVIEFIVAGIDVSPGRRHRAVDWIGSLGTAVAYRVPFAGFDLFIQLARVTVADLGALPSAPWLIWLAFFQRSGAKDFTHRDRNTFAVLADFLIAARSASRELQAAVLYAVVRTLFHPVERNGLAAAPVFAAMIPIARLREAVSQAQVKKSERQIINYDEDFLLWALLRSWSVTTDDQDRQVLVVDLLRLHQDVLGISPNGFAQDEDPGQTSISIPVQSLYRALAAQRPAVSERDIEALRPFFNDAAVREAFAPIQIEHRQAPQITEGAPINKRKSKPILGLR